MNKKIIEEIRLLYSIIIFVNVLIIVSSYALRFIAREDFNKWILFNSVVVSVYGIFLFIYLLSFWEKKFLKWLIVVSFYLLVAIATLTILISPVKVPVMSIIGAIFMVLKYVQLDNFKNNG